MTDPEVPRTHDSTVTPRLIDVTGGHGRREPIQHRHTASTFEPVDLALPNAGLSRAAAVCRWSLDKREHRVNLGFWMISLKGEAS